MRYVFENRLNVLLSELLGQAGVVSHSEQLGRGRKDIAIYHQGLRIVLEGSYTKNDAEKDATKRIEQLPVDMAIALVYPPFPQEMTEMEIKQKLKSSMFYVKIIVPRDISGTLYEYLSDKKVIAEPKEWIEADFNLLVNMIRESAQFIISEKHVKEVEDEVNELIGDFVDYLSRHHRSNTIARNLYNILLKLYGFSIGDATEIKEVIYAQAGLALLLSSTYYESIRYAYTKSDKELKPLKELKKAKGSQFALEKSTEDILGINYEPIFETTEQILKCLPSMSRILDSFIDLAVKIASKKSLLRRDIAGKIYHKIVGDWSIRKGLATYYTQIPAAYLLMYLAKPELSRICDFSCGSGTLVTATYSITRLQYGTSLLKKGVDKDPKEIDEEFHKSFVELCYCFDVLKYATQITAINLAMHSPETPLEESKSNIRALPLGFRKGNKRITSLGSLEWARITPRLDQIFKEATRVGVTKEEEEKLVNLEHFDLITMNPPFARATGRGGRKGGGLFGFIGDEQIREPVIEDYRKLREEIRSYLIKQASKFLHNTDLNLLIKDKNFAPYRSIGQAGEGLLFLYLADKMLKEDGKICFVLPKTLLSGISWFLARTLLASKYHIEYIVVSYDSENGYNFSESTSLSECLLVARKTKEYGETKFVILLRKPKTSIEAIALANLIGQIDGEEGYVETGESQAFVISVDRERLLEYIDNWGRFVFLPNLTLLKELKYILKGVIRIGNMEKKISITKLDNLISSIGIDRRQFGDNFEVIRKEVPGSLKILHGGGEDVRRKMKISPNVNVLPKKNGKRLFKEKAGRLLLPDRIWVDTAHVISLLSEEEPILANIFYAVKLKEENENKLKALCLWFNTTWGILTILANREETRGGWVSLKMSQWRLLPVLDVSSLSEDKIKELADVFDKFKNANLRRIPEQYRTDKGIDKSRIELDLAFLKAMGISIGKDDLLSLYKEIYSSMRQWMGMSKDFKITQPTDLLSSSNSV